MRASWIAWLTAIEMLEEVRIFRRPVLQEKCDHFLHPIIKMLPATRAAIAPNCALSSLLCLRVCQCSGVCCTALNLVGEHTHILSGTCRVAVALPCHAVADRWTVADLATVACAAAQAVTMAQVRVKVTFHAARNLKETEFFGTQDPKVKVQVFGRNWESATCQDGGKNPSALGWLGCPPYCSLLTSCGLLWR